MRVFRVQLLTIVVLAQLLCFLSCQAPNLFASVRWTIHTAAALSVVGDLISRSLALPLCLGTAGQVLEYMVRVGINAIDRWVGLHTARPVVQNAAFIRVC